jgi:hypothetical protein
MPGRNSLAAAIVLFLMAQAAFADDLEALKGAAERVAVHNRAAMRQLREGNLEVAAAQISALRSAWDELITGFDVHGLRGLHDETLYVAVTTDTATRIATASIVLDIGRPDAAYTSLRAIRENLAKLRRAAGIEVLADGVLESNNAFISLVVAFDAWLRDKDSRIKDDLFVAVERYLQTLQRCATLADSRALKNPIFGQSIDRLRDLLREFETATAMHDNDAIARVMKEMRALDDRLTLYFG